MSNATTTSFISASSSCMASLPVIPAPNPHTSPLKPSKSFKFTQPHLTKLQQNGNKNHQNLYKSYFHHISSLCKDCQIQEAVDLLTEMEFENLQIGPEIYGELLQGCVYERDLFTGQQIHARILKNGNINLLPCCITGHHSLTLLLTSLFSLKQWKGGGIACGKSQRLLFSDHHYPVYLVSCTSKEHGD